jgi:hypothetical protein
MNRGKRKVPLQVGCMMVGIAFLVDLASIVLEIPTMFVGGLIIDFFVSFVFWIWLGNYHVKLYGERNFLGTAAATILSALPVGDLLFPWTVRIGTLVWTEREKMPTDATMRYVRTGDA